VSRDELIGAAVRALHTCTEADKELDTANTVVGVVGAGERFTVLEGVDVAPFLVDLASVPKPAGAGAAAAAQEAEMDVEAEGRRPPQPAAEGAGVPPASDMEIT